MDTLLKDLRFALRALRRDLTVTLVAIVSLALAVGGNAVVFSLVNALVLRPMPYPDVEEIVVFGERAANAAQGALPTVLPANYLDLAERQGSLDETAAFWGAALSLDTGGDTPQQLLGATVTPGFFRLFGVEMLRGRSFTDEEGVPGNDRVAVLTRKFWIEHYGGEGDPTGEVLRLNGEPYEIVGVAGEFELFLSPRCQVWLPLALDAATARRQGRGIFAFGRLAEGVSLEASRAEMSKLMEELVDEYPEENRGRLAAVARVSESVPDRDTRLLVLMTQGALFFVLLIACANLANLLLARGRKREREIALRGALGATRGRIARQLLTESLVLALAAGLLGVALGAAAIRVLGTALAAQLPSWSMPSLDPGVLLFSLAVTVLSGLLFGLAPVLQTARTDFVAALKEGRTSTAGGRRRLAANGLVVLEIALAMVFLAGAAALLEGFQKIQSTDAGFRTDNVLLMIVRLPERFDTPESRASGMDQLTERLSQVPGVKAVTASNLAPLVSGVPRTPWTVDGRPPADGAVPEVDWLAVRHGYFEALGIALAEGRTFTAADSPDAVPVVVVNRAAARRDWPDGSAVGRRVTVLGESREVVGVVADVRHGVFETKEAPPTVYLPWAQQSTALFRVMVTSRDGVGAASLLEPVRGEAQAFDRALAVTRVQTLAAYEQRFFVGDRILTVILGGFGLLALALAVLGVYGVLSYSVALRRHEIGIRMAVGATRWQVVGLVLRQGLTLGLVGLLLGAPGVWAVVRVSASILSAFVPVNTAVVAAVAVLLAATTVAASFLPARRAATVDPAVTLRSE